MNWIKEIDNISNWIKTYLEQSGCAGYICGCSGGIDSAVVTCLTVKAIGKGNIIAVALPCESDPNALDDALMLSKNLNIELRVLDITNSYNTIIEELEKGGETVTQLTKGNIKSRLRMVNLYALANQYNYLVAGTSNFSEIMVGYGTKYGDLSSDIEIIGNYYKTEIYEMASCFPQIPPSIKLKKPSADLYPGQQSDEETFGMTYETLDTILAYLTENAVIPGTISDEQINKVKNMMSKAKHKNNLPPKYIRI